MFGIGALLQASNAVYSAATGLAVGLRVWVDTLLRDRFLKKQFDHVGTMIVHNLNSIRQNTWPVDSIKVVAIMPTVSYTARVENLTELDACVFFCVINMDIDALEELFQHANEQWYQMSDIASVDVFKTVTLHGFEDRMHVFKKSLSACRFSREIVHLIKIEYATLCSTNIMAVCTFAGFRPEWVHDGLNTTSDNALCLNGAMQYFDRMMNEMVRTNREAQRALQQQ